MIMAMKVRRVVTGHGAGGKAVFASDALVDPIEFGAGGAYHVLWGGDAPARFPDDGSPPAWSAPFPPVGGHRFLLMTLPVGAVRGSDDEQLSSFLADSLGDIMEKDEPGMHKTATIDFEVVLSGKIGLELDDGAEVVLGPGDVVVQNGTRHRWHNRGTEPATMAVIVIGAHHDAM
jgi:mannose-6-phosphate isomerase-like protein (cupin superfamily)